MTNCHLKQAEQQEILTGNRQIRQVIKYSMWKAAQFVIVQRSAIHLTVLI